MTLECLEVLACFLGVASSFGSLLTPSYIPAVMPTLLLWHIQNLHLLSQTLSSSTNIITFIISFGKKKDEGKILLFPTSSTSCELGCCSKEAFSSNCWHFTSRLVSQIKTILKIDFFLLLAKTYLQSWTYHTSAS